MVNIVSSAKTLFNRSTREVLCNGIRRRKDKFKQDVLSKKYDEVFAYRFMIYIRNYAQHGHLPIGRIYDEKRFCFDLMQILTTHHIKPNKAIKESMIKVHDEIIERFEDEPRVAVTYMIDSFTVTVYEIYYVFLQTIEDDVKEIFSKRLYLLNIYPKLIYKGNNVLNGYVVYQIGENNELHVYDPNECLLNTYNEYKEEAKSVYYKYKAEHVEVG